MYIFSNFMNKYCVNDELSFESRTLNFVCYFGSMAVTAALISRLIAGLPFITVAPLLLMLAAILGILFISINRATYADTLTNIIVCGVSIVFWPILFFTIGGPGSGMAVYFALAIILDFTLLKGGLRTAALIITCAITVFCYTSTLFWGWQVLPEGGLSPFQLFIDYMQSILIVGFLAGSVSAFQINLFLHEKNKAEAAVTERNESMLQLEAAQLTTAAMFESNPHINILFDSNFRVVDCNPAAVRFMLFDTKEDLRSGLMQRLKEAIPDTLATGRNTRPVAEWFMQVIKDGYVRLETEFVLGGSTRNVDIELRRIPYGDSVAIVGYILDMTDTHNMLSELEKQRKEALAANQAKSNFLSTMSHEIRTPMNAILGITEIQLQNDALDQEVKEALSKVYMSGDLLLGIINDILDLSKIEAGKLEIITDKYEIASLISDTAQLNMMRIGSKAIEFALSVDENLPMNLKGDHLRVKQILNNVLSNAFKYTDAGKVHLSVAADLDGGEAEGNVTLVFSISDTGQGMTREQVAKLFEEYTRFNMDVNRTTEGTGLGMTITRNLIDLMKGSIHVESEPGKGTTVTMRLPQGRIGAAVLGREMADNLHKFRTNSRTHMKRVQITREPMPYGRVLIVDDVETNIYVARGLLLPYGLKIDSAESGFTAIDKIKNGNIYDIVFMDHMMPKMDGVEATKILRDMGYDRSIVALTANAVAGQAEIFLGNGFDDFISKPIDIRQLNTVLNKLIRDKQPPEVIEAARKQAEEEQGLSFNAAPGPAVDPQFIEFFVRDAQKALATLEAISAKDDYSNEDDLRSYIINVHGMKSALANIGKMDLSAVALKLETAGREGKIEIITSETGDFLDSLREYVEELAPQEETATREPEDEDKTYLHEKLLVIKTACEDFDESTAEEALTELRGAAWSQTTREFLGNVSELLLHSEFDEIVESVDNFIQ